jgi:hypothetical protein
MFHVNGLYEIDVMFNGHPGPGLRHRMAHGMVSTADCFGVDTIYGCWFIYQLVCAPPLDNWKTDIAPGIEEQSL